MLYSYVEKPGTWSIDMENLNFVIEYSNSNDITLIPIVEDIRSNIDSTMVLACYVNRSKMISVYTTAAGKSPEFAITVDEGGTWKQCEVSAALSPHKQFTYAHIGFCSENFGWCFLGNDGDLSFGTNCLYITEDSGISWNEMPPFEPLKDSVVNSIIFSTPQKGFLCTNRRRSDGKAPIYKTEDGGNTWEEMELPLNEDNVIYEGTGISFNGPFGVLQLSCNGTDGKKYTALYSCNWGKTWKVVT
jgi:photosystem II stability/assembly factor-like uncharacterized protein